MQVAYFGLKLPPTHNLSEGQHHPIMRGLQVLLR